MIVYALDKVLLNETEIPDGEVLGVLEAVKQTEVEYQLGNIVFYPIGNSVVGVRKGLSRLEAEALLFRRLWMLKPYPEWIVDLSKFLNVQGNHYLVLTAGDNRFSLRERFSPLAMLVYNTGNEDLYVSRFELEIEGPYISVYGENVLENLRRAYSILKHHSLKARVSFETLDSLECDCDIPDLSSTQGLIEALKIFRTELVDVRIPEEVCLVSRRD